LSWSVPAFTLVRLERPQNAEAAHFSWRDTHAVAAILVGFFIYLPGDQPLASVWGAKVNEWANGNNSAIPRVASMFQCPTNIPTTSPAELRR
jgi:uncharacterized iron-regulated membrane protein